MRERERERERERGGARDGAVTALSQFLVEINMQSGPQDQ